MPRSWRNKVEQQGKVGAISRLGTIVFLAVSGLVGFALSSVAMAEEKPSPEPPAASAEQPKEVVPAKDVDELLTRWTKAVRVGDARELRVLVDWENIFEQS